MSKLDKPIKRLLINLKILLGRRLKNCYQIKGFEKSDVGKASGSRVRFYLDKNIPPLTLHKPHPKPIFKAYQIKHIIDCLQGVNLL
jgi:hypothetical protein